MRKKIMAAGASAMALSMLAIAAPASAATPRVNTSAISPLNAGCGRAGPNIQNQRVNNVAIHGAAQQRNGSSTSCPALGVLQPTDDAIYFCWTFGNDGFTWTYLKNIRTGVRSWTRDNLLRNNGGRFFCGF